MTKANKEQSAEPEVDRNWTPDFPYPMGPERKPPDPEYTGDRTTARVRFTLDIQVPLEWYSGRVTLEDIHARAIREATNEVAKICRSHGDRIKIVTVEGVETRTFTTEKKR